MDCDSDDSDNWEEVADVGATADACCLFCEERFGDAGQALGHVASRHNVDLGVVCRRLDLNCYGYIKMVNYIRREKPAADMFLSRSNTPSLWADDHYMMPVIADDPLLMVDIEAITTETAQRLQCAGNVGDVSTNALTPFPCQQTTSAFVDAPGVTSTDLLNFCHHGALVSADNVTPGFACVHLETENIPTHTGSPQQTTSAFVDATGGTHVPSPTNLLNFCHHGALVSADNGTPGFACVHLETENIPTNTGTVTLQRYTELASCHRQSELNNKLMADELTRSLADMQRMKELYDELLTTQCTQQNAGPMTGEDDAYFTSYAHFGIHQEMLQDTVRTAAYQKFFYSNPGVVKDKAVLDVGCGTGILSLFAARAGAAHVTGVDQSDIVYSAYDIVNENRLAEKIIVLKGRLEDTALPLQKYDLIVSEWMGYFLLYESMLESVLYARDNYLKPTGVVFPDRCSLSIAGVDDQESRKSCVDFWDDVYGFKMSCMKREVSKEAGVAHVSPDCLITQPCIIKNLDLMTCVAQDLQFVSHFSLTIQRDGSLTALVGFFDVFFERGLAVPITLSTAPSGERTHWKQTVFYLPTARRVTSGDVVAGSLSVGKMSKDPRSLVIEISIFDDTHRYVMP